MRSGKKHRQQLVFCCTTKGHPDIWVWSNGESRIGLCTIKVLDFLAGMACCLYDKLKQETNIAFEVAWRVVLVSLLCCACQCQPFQSQSPQSQIGQGAGFHDFNSNSKEESQAEFS